MGNADKMRTVVVTADDYGLTQGINETILAAVDGGALTRVSILANGLAFDHAIEEYKKRSGLGIALHLNLTEGRSLTGPSCLTDAEGNFRYSSLALIAATMLSTSVSRAMFRRAIEREVIAQIEKVSGALHTPFGVDGHQHVHMVPLVMEVLTSLHPRFVFSGIRIPRERFVLIPSRWSHYFGAGLFRHIVLNALSWRARTAATAVGISCNDCFVGTLFSGTLSTMVVAETLAQSSGAVEIAVHPGTPQGAELDGWLGNRAWHYLTQRTRERGMLLTEEFRQAVSSYTSGTLASRHDATRIMRFIVSGSFAALTHVSILYGLTEYGGVWYLASATLGWCVGFLVSFSLQRFWTFGDRPARPGHMPLYAALQIGNVALNAAGVAFLTEFVGVWYIASQVVMIGVVAAWTYLASSRFIFAPEHTHRFTEHSSQP